MIPLVSQIVLGGTPGEPLPEPLRLAVDSVRRAFPACRHAVHDEASLREFIAAHYDADVVETFDALQPYAYKSDLGRYCLLHADGGWYFDLGVVAQTGVELGDGVAWLAFRDLQRYTPTCWSCHTAVLYSHPGNPALRTAIQMIVRNRRENYYGLTPVCPTGPVLLGEALAAHRSDAAHLYGDVLELTPAHRNRNAAFVLPDGTILAWRKRAQGGDLSALGLKGGNNYNELWQARRVYSPPSDPAVPPGAAEARLEYRVPQG